MGQSDTVHLVSVLLIGLFLLLAIHLSKPARIHTRRKRIKRRADRELPQHKKRKRKQWTPLKTSLGPELFRVHHRVTEELFQKIHHKIKKHIHKEAKYVRKTCCTGDVSHIDSRARLSMTLKHLGGSRTCDIASFHGVSRQTVGAAIRQTFDAIKREYPISPFPFDDDAKLQELADGFKAKSTAGLFDSVVGVLDGFLLRVGKTCIGNKSGCGDPSKFYCRKKYYALNCQVCCDSNRKITSLSLRSPGAVPDTLAHMKSELYWGIASGKLPARFHFLGDGAYPRSEQMTTPYNRTELRRDVGKAFDNFNYYLSQLRINIECCFGMLVNKFPILESALKTPLLSTAVDTFYVCCIVHNLCIDERLASNSNERYSFPPGKRYTQVAKVRSEMLRSQQDFEYVPLVDEVTAHDFSLGRCRGTQVDTEDLEEDATLSRKEKLVRKISRLGYVRPT